MDLKVKQFVLDEKTRRKELFPRKGIRILLFSLAGALAVAAGIVFYIVYNEGVAAEKNAKKLLEEYEQGLHQEASSPVVTNEPPAGISPAASGAIPTTVPTPGTYEGYFVIGKLIIEKTEQQLPIISETSDEALKVSCCYFKGSMPGEKGNMIITGHAYASGAIFGRLNELKTGDKVVISTPQFEYTYEVCATEVIKPDETEKLNEYQGETALTLLTCTSHGNRRLLVKCSLTGMGANAGY